MSSSVPGYFAEPVLEPQHGVEVEVVGRLVQQQEVRTAHQRLREVQPHPPAAGKARHGIRRAAPRESPGRRAASRRARANYSRRCRRSGGAAPRAPRRRARGPVPPPLVLLRLRAIRGRHRARIRWPVWRRRASPARHARWSTTAAARSIPRREGVHGGRRRRGSTCRSRSRRPGPPCDRRGSVRLAPSSRRLVPRASVRFADA